MSVFGYHFMIGFFSSSRHHSFKGFWAEYAACRMFAQLMLLAALQVSPSPRVRVSIGVAALQVSPSPSLSLSPSPSP